MESENDTVIAAPTEQQSNVLELGTNDVNNTSDVSPEKSTLSGTVIDDIPQENDEQVTQIENNKETFPKEISTSEHAAVVISTDENTKESNSLPNDSGQSVVAMTDNSNQHIIIADNSSQPVIMTDDLTQPVVITDDSSQSVIMTDGSPILLDSSALALPNNSEGIFLIQTTESGVTETHVIARVQENTDLTSPDYMYTTPDVLNEICVQNSLVETEDSLSENSKTENNLNVGEVSGTNKQTICEMKDALNNQNEMKINNKSVGEVQITESENSEQTISKEINLNSENETFQNVKDIIVQDVEIELTNKDSSMETSLENSRESTSELIENENSNDRNNLNTINIEISNDITENIVELPQEVEIEKQGSNKAESKIKTIPNIAETIVSDWTFDDPPENDGNASSDTINESEQELVLQLDDSPRPVSNNTSQNDTNPMEEDVLQVVSNNSTDNRILLNTSAVESQKKLTLDDITKDIQETEQKENRTEKSINNNMLANSTPLKNENMLNDSQYEVLTDVTVIQVDQSTNDAIPVTIISVNENYEIETLGIIEQHKKAAASSSCSRKSIMPLRSDGVPIPCHLLGRSLDNPQEDLVANGRALPKPRLGVKVPYRYLTSQICSKDEIAREIIAKTSVESPDVPKSGDVFFVKKLFKNLVSKILPSEEKQTLEKELAQEENEKTPTATSSKLSDDKSIRKQLKTLDGGNKKKFKKLTMKQTDKKDLKVQAKVSDQELIAILEGNSDVNIMELKKKGDVSPPILTPEDTDAEPNFFVGDTPPKLEVGNISKNAASIPVNLDDETIRRIALKQLSELPLSKKSKKERPIVIKKPRGRPRKYPLPMKKSVENFVIDPNDPFAFDENSRPSELPKYEPLVPPRVVKTYGKKVDQGEPEPENIIIPKEILDIEIQNENESTDKSIEEDCEEKVSDNENVKIDSDKNSSKENEVSHEDASENKNEIVKNIKKSRTEKSGKENKIIIRKESMIDKPLVLTSKRARVIKRKVIWDPDEVQPSRKPTEKKPVKVSESSDDAMPPQSSEPPAIKKSLTSKTSLISRESFRNAKRTLLKRLHNRKFTKKFAISKASHMPILKKKRPKKMSELDRLLMDEGALNMLYSVERDESPAIKDKQRVISMDKFEREMNKKKKAVMTVLSTTPDSSPKILRKKDSPNIPQRKKSRDSVHSSIHTPPPSPGAMFPPRAEASRIIRRHSSSSSFSSGCASPRRLSMTEPEKKISLELEAKNDEEKDSSQDRKRRGIPIYVKQKEQKTYKGKKRNVEDEKESKELNDVFVPDSKKDERLVKTDGARDKSMPIRKRKLIEELSVFNDEKKSKKNDTDADEKIKNDVDESRVKMVDSDSRKKISGDDKQKANTRQNVKTYNYKEISLRHFDHLVQIILTPTSTKSQNLLNLQAIKELCDALSTLKKNSLCRAVLLTSTGSAFCKGIDYSYLIQPTLDKRKTVATEMINSIRELVHTVAGFPYPLIAGVQGATSGLGVAILPLCDLVLVSDRATFSMPYAKFGCIPEAAASVTLPHVTSLAATSELLLAGHTITAAEALRHGLASRVLWPDNFQQDLILISKGIAAQSSQSMNAMKNLLRQSLYSKVEAAMDSESDLIVQQWISSECQQNFKNVLEQDDW